MGDDRHAEPEGAGCDPAVCLVVVVTEAVADLGALVAELDVGRQEAGTRPDDLSRCDPIIEPAQAPFSPTGPSGAVAHLGDTHEGDEDRSSGEKSLVLLRQRRGGPQQVGAEHVRVDHDRTALVDSRVHISLIADQKASASCSVSSSMTISS